MAAWGLGTAEAPGGAPGASAEQRSESRRAQLRLREGGGVEQMGRGGCSSLAELLKVLELVEGVRVGALLGCWLVGLLDCWA
jgi:hypothetical protein